MGYLLRCSPTYFLCLSSFASGQVLFVDNSIPNHAINTTINSPILAMASFHSAISCSSFSVIIFGLDISQHTTLNVLPFSPLRSRMNMTCTLTAFENKSFTFKTAQMVKNSCPCLHWNKSVREYL